MKKGDEPAYPTEISYDKNTNESVIAHGLTVREYFAAMAMQGLLQNYQSHQMYGNHPSYPVVAEAAVSCADQLILELNKPQTNSTTAP